MSHKQTLFEGYVKEYRKLLDPLSFSRDWKQSDKEKQCFATRVLFDPDSF